jgi:hypothetical protein
VNLGVQGSPEALGPKWLTGNLHRPSGLVYLKVGRKGGKGKGERFGFFFLIFFKIIFQTFKLHSNKKPCIRIFIISNFI